MNGFIFAAIVIFLTCIRVFIGTDEFDCDHDDDYDYELPDYCYKSTIDDDYEF